MSTSASIYTYTCTSTACVPVQQRPRTDTDAVSLPARLPGPGISLGRLASGQSCPSLPPPSAPFSALSPRPRARRPSSFRKVEAVRNQHPHNIDRSARSFPGHMCCLLRAPCLVLKPTSYSDVLFTPTFNRFLLEENPHLTVLPQDRNKNSCVLAPRTRNRRPWRTTRRFTSDTEWMLGALAM